MRLCLTLAYNGSAWQGWQWQAPPAPTIQGELERAFLQLIGSRCRVFGAGRTDSGVHALGQVAHVDVPFRPWDWRKHLNAVLHPDISIISAREVTSGFHARKDAVAKTYFFNFWQEPSFMDPRQRTFVWACGPSDTKAMERAAGHFLGERDFASFQNSGTTVKSTVRTIYHIKICTLPQEPFLPQHLPPLRLEICGNGFLKQMVRNIAGFLAAVGSGKASGDDLPAILAARNRTALYTPTAPARGLFLARVHYGETVHVS